MKVKNITQIKNGITMNVGVIVKMWKTCEKESYLELCNMYWENGKYVGSIIDDSVIICDEIVEGTRLVTTYNTSTNVYVLLAFSLITMAFLIAVSIYCLYTISQLKKTGYWKFNELLFRHIFEIQAYIIRIILLYYAHSYSDADFLLSLGTNDFLWLLLKYCKD